MPDDFSSNAFTKSLITPLSLRQWRHLWMTNKTSNVLTSLFSLSWTIFFWIAFESVPRRVSDVKADWKLFPNDDVANFNFSTLIRFKYSWMLSTVIPKGCSEEHWWSSSSYTNQYFVLLGPPNDSKWSAHRKSLGTTGLAHDYIYYQQSKWSRPNYSHKKLFETWWQSEADSQRPPSESPRRYHSWRNNRVRSHPKRQPEGIVSS